MEERSPDSDPSSESHAPERRLGTRALLVFGAAFLSAVGFAVVVLLVTSKFDPLLRLDRNTADDLHEFAVRHKAFTGLMRLISNLGSSLAWWIIMVPVMGWLLYRKLRRLALFVLVTTLGSTVLNNLIKLVVDRARPVLPDPVASAGGKSFPSGHTQAAVVGYGILLSVFIPVVPRRWRPVVVAAACVMALSIGFSRIALGVHYLSDVMGAYLVGTVWLLGMVAAFRAWRREEGKPAAAVTEGLEPEERDQIAP